MDDVGKLRSTELVNSNKRRNSEPNFNSTKWFPEKLTAIVMIKAHVMMNRPVYLGFSILDLSKIQIYEYWYDYTKKKLN